MNSEISRSEQEPDVEMAVDLSNCEREPIHIPGLIQPHGVLFALSSPSLAVLQVSGNTPALLGQEPQHFLAQPLANFLPADQLTYLAQCLQCEDMEVYNPLQLTFNVAGIDKAFDGIIHHVENSKDAIALLELEPHDARADVTLPHFYHIMRTSTTVLQGASDLHVLSQSMARIIADLTGFDRVMIYRFHPDWHGEVIAEVKQADLEPYLGLHYPASDIPAQARELYRRNWLRLISDVAYEPSPIIPTDNPITHQPLDLSTSVLRSVSPMHIQYLKNMGVGASMSVSILKNNQLWGLISCHHRKTNYVPYTVRAACEFLGQLFSLQISAREDVDDYAYTTHIRELYDRVSTSLFQYDDIFQGLRQDAQSLMEMVNAQGIAFSFGEDSHHMARAYSFGVTPSQENIQLLVAWLQQQHGALFSTDVLPSLFPAARQFKDTASGVLALSIASWHDGYVLWFRPEVLREVQWGGDPEKPMQAEGNSLVLRPRSSFNAWSQTVRCTSQPWKAPEVEAARDLRSIITDRLLRMILVQRSQELLSLNEQLEKSNSELDSFAYIVSHDLKEPLRGINNYVHILKEDYGTVLDEEGIDRLNTLTRLAHRLDSLIDGLLRYSRVGHVDLSFAQVDLNVIVARAIELTHYQLDQAHMQVRIPRTLPTVYCDQVRVGEIFSNLITNAIKYRGEKPESWIEIGSLNTDNQHEATVPVFYVRDNGIGIHERYFTAIFQIFRRLHARDKFGGGTGVGLSIVKRIVERHGGTIWVESKFGEGTTFYFTLQDEKGQHHDTAL